MKTRFLFTVAAIAALLGATATVRAQEMGFANLTDPNSLVVSAAENDSNSPFKLCNVENLLDATACCEQPRFETSASLLFLKPSSGSLEYGTLVYPLPPPSPHWENQTISPSYSPAFNVGVRYFVPETGNDLRTSWTHLTTTDSASFSGGVTNFAGPPYLIGPGATAYNRGTGTVNFGYDAVNAEAGHLFCVGSPFQVRVHGGVQYASISQTLTGSFSDFAGTNTHTDTTDSTFSGAGPRFGVNAQFNRRHFQFIGDMAVCALMGTQHLRQDFNTTSPLLPAGNPQSFTSPNATQVVPGFDFRLGASRSFPTAYGLFKFEAGYQTVVYLNAINSYSLTQVAVPPVVGGVGVFMATAQHLQNNFTAHGPYMQASWAF